MKREYIIHGRLFATQAALEAEIRGHLAAHGAGPLWQDDWLAAVINTLNADVRAAGQRVTGWFRRLDWEGMLMHGLRPPYHFEGLMLVAEFAPSGRWCDLSAYPWHDSRGHHSNLRAVLLDEEEEAPAADLAPRVQFTVSGRAKARTAATLAEMGKRITNPVEEFARAQEREERIRRRNE